MKQLINEIEESSGNVYRLWAEINDVDVPTGYKQLKFTSEWTGAKNPKLEYNKGQFFLSTTAFDNLKTLVNSK
jgi:hypothetical protein